jgi:hypothetical protein
MWVFPRRLATLSSGAGEGIARDRGAEAAALLQELPFVGGGRRRGAR